MKIKNTILPLTLLSLTLLFTGCDWWPFCCKKCKKGEKAKKAKVEKAKKISVSVKIEDAASFDNAIKDKDLSVVKFWAPWCGACNKLDPTYEAVAQDNKVKYNFYSVNIDKLKEVSKEFGIKGIPSILFFKEGKEVGDKIVGVISEKELVSKIKAADEAK